MLICTPGDSYCDDTIIRYNISQNDGINSARIFHFGGGTRNTMIYNNVIYVGAKQELTPPPVHRLGRQAYAQNTHFQNNIFYVDGRVTYDWGKSTKMCSRTMFSSESTRARPHDPGVRLDQAPAPESGRRSERPGFTGRLQTPSGRALRRGSLIPNNGGRDFFGNPVSAREPALPGVFEGRR